MSNLKFAVIGAGNGGKSMAALLIDKGCSVKLMDIDKSVVEDIKQAGKITLTGKYDVTVNVGVVTTDAVEAIEGADVIMVVTTANGHEQVAKDIAGAIKPNQIVVLNPGMFCGSLAFRTQLKQYGCPHDILVAETSDLIFGCRKGENGAVFHSGLKKKMALASVPASEAGKVAELLGSVLPVEFLPQKNILYTSMNSIGAILHSIPMIMNVNKMDLNQSWDYYMDGITASIARIAEACDAERVALAKLFGIEVVSCAQSVMNTYGCKGNNLYEVIQDNGPAYAGIKGPASLAHRFCSEDTFGSLVAFATVAKELGMATPAMDAVITCISLATGIDYFTEGRTAAKMGLKGKTVEEIYAMID